MAKQRGNRARSTFHPALFQIAVAGYRARNAVAHLFFVGDDSAYLHFDEDALPEGWESALRWAHLGGISLARQPLAEPLVSLAERLKALGIKVS